VKVSWTELALLVTAPIKVPGPYVHETQVIFSADFTGSRPRSEALPSVPLSPRDEEEYGGRRLLYPRKEAAYMLGISLRSLDHLVANKMIRTQRISKRVLIHREGITAVCKS
jgi:hypothetical protein